jgi:hypothetical protein
VRKIADLLAPLGNRQWTDGNIEPTLGKAGKISSEVGLAKLKIDTELFRDLSPQLDADARPRAVGVLDIEWRANGDADDKLLLWNCWDWQWRRKVLSGRLRSAHGQNQKT